MKRTLISIFLSGISVAVIAQTPATGGKYTPTKTAIRQLDSLYKYLGAKGLYNGNILVASGGKAISRASIGFANLDTREKLTAASTFELASLSKQFTAVGILTLVQAGKLSLDQPLLSIFPTLPYTGVTIRQLLNHTAGIPDYIRLFATNWNYKRIATNTDVVAILSRLHPPQTFSAGQKFEYSNTGYALLGAVIEKVSGKSYAAYMQEAVFAPLGLKHTTVYTRRAAPRVIKGYAYGYVEDDAGNYRLPDSLMEHAQVRYLDGITGDGAVNSTTGDLLIWDEAVRNQKLLSPALWKEAITTTITDGKDNNYGFGFQVINSPANGRVLTHNGGWPGYETRNTIYLDRDIDLIFLGNKELPMGQAQSVWDAVRDITFGRPYKLPAPLQQVEAEIDTAVLSNYIGTYTSALSPSFEIVVRASGGRLTAQATGQGIVPLTPESATIFFLKGAPIRIEFVTEGSGPAPRLILHQNGDQLFNRKP